MSKNFIEEDFADYAARTIASSVTAFRNTPDELVESVAANFDLMYQYLVPGDVYCAGDILGRGYWAGLLPIEQDVVLMVLRYLETDRGYPLVRLNDSIAGEVRFRVI